MPSSFVTNAVFALTEKIEFLIKRTQKEKKSFRKKRKLFFYKNLSPEVILGEIDVLFIYGKFLSGEVIERGWLA